MGMKKYLDSRIYMMFLRDRDIFNMVGVESINMEIMKYKFGRNVWVVYESYMEELKFGIREDSVVIRYVR